MKVEEFYIINPHMMYIMGCFDRNGKLCSMVKEVEREFMVDKSPTEILEQSIKCIGFDLRGAVATSKWILGDIHMLPVMINHIHKICVFPSMSSKHPDTMWFNPYHIVRTYRTKRKTIVLFRNGHTLKLDIKLTSFNTKLKNAEQLCYITVEIANDPNSFIIDPNKRKTKII